MRENQKVAIVMSGGGMSCSYSAGVLYALVKEYKFIDPDILIATSGSAGSAFYYLAGQYDEIKEIWLKRLSTSRFISLLRVWQIMDVNYLIDEVFKKQVPINLPTLENTKTNCYIPVTSTRTHKVRYISNREKSIPLKYCVQQKRFQSFLERK